MNPGSKKRFRFEPHKLILEVTDFRDIFNLWRKMDKAEKRQYLYPVTDRDGNARNAFTARCGVNERYFYSFDGDKIQEFQWDNPNENWVRIKKFSQDQLLKLL